MQVQFVNLLDALESKYFSTFVIVVILQAFVSNFDQGPNNLKQIFIIVLRSLCEDRIHTIVQNLHIALSGSLQLFLTQ